MKVTTKFNKNIGLLQSGVQLTISDHSCGINYMLWDKCLYIGFNNVTNLIKGLQNVKTLKVFFPEVYFEPSQTSKKELFAKALSMFNWVLNSLLYLEM